MKIFYLLLLLVIGCSQRSNLYYYNKIDKNGNLSKEEKLLLYPNTKEKDLRLQENVYNGRQLKKEYCIYGIAYIIPINFWDITLNTTSEEIQQAIKDLNKEGKRGNSMENILFIISVNTIFPFTWVCTEITGTLVTEE